MLRQTVIIAASLIAVWALGVSALGFIPEKSGAAAIENSRPPVVQVNASVLSIEQDRSGRFTVYVSRPVRDYLDIEHHEEF